MSTRKYAYGYEKLKKKKKKKLIESQKENDQWINLLLVINKI